MHHGGGGYHQYVLIKVGGNFLKFHIFSESERPLVYLKDQTEVGQVHSQQLDNSSKCLFQTDELLSNHYMVNKVISEQSYVRGEVHTGQSG